MQQLHNITYLKAICALVVCFIHFKIFIIDLKNIDLNYLFYFVHFFFVISGFVIFIKYYNNIITFSSVIHFIKKRFLRLYPLHIFFLVLFLLLETTKMIAQDHFNIKPNYDPFIKNNFESFIYNIFLVHNIFGNPLSFNGPSWAVGSEFFTYLVFSLTIFILRKKIIIPIILFILFYSKYYSSSVFYSVHGFSTNLNCLFAFIIGGLFGLIFIKKNFFLVILIVLFLLIFIIYNKSYLALLPFLFGYILYFSSPKKKIFHKKNFFINRFFQFIGKISYSIYLTHSLVLWIVIQIFNIVLNINVYEFSLLNTILFLLFLYFLTIIIAYLSYKYIENSFYQKL
jgi:peptidoglycan/LPS O-acetylase OafA/YrhL